MKRSSLGLLSALVSEIRVETLVAVWQTSCLRLRFQQVAGRTLVTNIFILWNQVVCQQQRE